MDNKNTSNIIDLDKYIENNIEKKINQLLDVLPQKINEKTPKMIYEYTIEELYNGVINTIINIINEITALNQERKYMETREYIKKILKIFLQNDRKIFVGIVLVILSFIIYFIDGAEV